MKSMKTNPIRVTALSVILAIFTMVIGFSVQAEEEPRIVLPDQISCLICHQDIGGIMRHLLQIRFEMLPAQHHTETEQSEVEAFLKALDAAQEEQ